MVFRVHMLVTLCCAWNSPPRHHVPGTALRVSPQMATSCSRYSPPRGMPLCSMIKHLTYCTWYTKLNPQATTSLKFVLFTRIFELSRSIGKVSVVELQLSINYPWAPHEAGRWFYMCKVQYITRVGCRRYGRNSTLLFFHIVASE